MKCVRLVLSNFCNHEYRELHFGTGVIGILGQNGSGKSNVFAGIRLALTGYNSNAGTKLSNVYAKAKKGAPSYVELEFTHGSVHAVVRRNIRPASPTATLCINNGKPIEGDVKVTAAIEQLLGITSDVINDIVIVEQEAIFGFLSAQPAKRLEQFQRLFGTDAAIGIHKQIGDHIRGVQIPASCTSIDLLRQQLTEATNQRDELTRQLGGGVDTAVLLQQLTDIASTQSRYREWLQCQQRITEADANFSTAATMVTNLTAQLQQAEATRIDTQTQFDNSQLLAEKAQADLANAESSKRSRDYRASLEANVKNASAAVEVIQRGVPVPSELVTNDIVATELVSEQLTQEIAALSRFVNSFSGDTVECPTCHTPVSSLQGNIETSRTQLAQKQSQLESQRQILHATRTYNAAVAVFNTKLTASTDSLIAATNNLSQHQLITVQPFDIAVAQSLIESRRIKQQQLNAAVNEVNRLTTDIRIMTERRDAALAVGNREREIINTHNLASMATVDITTLATMDTNIRAALTNRQTSEQQLSQVTANIANLEQRIVDEGVIAVRAAKTREWITYAEQLRDLYAREAAPRFVSQTNLQRLEVSINEVLESFTAPFRVTATEGLSFVATFMAGYQQPADRLSPGQKVLLALAFRLSLNLMFANNIGAMYLDEPTAWMDKQRIQGFEPVLGQLRAFAASRGLQTIIITHESDLAPLFDTTIAL